MSSTTDADANSAPITINVKGPSEIKLSLPVTLDMTVRQLKEAIQQKRSDVTADSQRLIYSGKVLKDEETLANYKLQNNHTVHMVRSASRSAPTTGNPSTGASPAAAAASSAPTSSAASSAAQGVPANFGAGQQFTNNPLSALNRADFAGPHMANLGHQMFEGTGMNPNDPNFMMNAMQSPEFRSHMRQMMSRPEFVDQMMALNPQLAQMPGAREMLQSDFFREMLMDPQAMQRAAQFGAAMRGGGGGAGGAGAGLGGLGSLFGGAGAGAGAGAAPQWPPPGAFGTPAAGNANANPTTGDAANTTTGAGATGAAPPNPFAALAGLGGAGGAGGLPGLDPAALQQLQQMFGGAGAGAGGAPAGGDPFAALRALGLGGGAGAGLGGAAAGAAANDSRPPEERFASQLEQMEGMGLDRAASLQALVLTGGSVERAMALIFDGNLSNFS